MGQKLLVFGFVSSLLMFFIGLILIIFNDKFLRLFVASNIRLDPSTDLYKQWLNPPIEVYLSFYIFDLKNPIEFENGSKPFLEEIGPFVFREYIVKEDIIDNLNYTISYNERKRYIFVPELSPYELEYPITTLNMGPVTIINTVKYQSSFIHNAVNAALKLTGETLLVTKMPAKDLLFGYKDNFLAQLKKLVPNLVPTDTVGLFIDKNNTIDGYYTIFNGADDYNKVGVVERFNRQDKMNIWSTKYANMINGTDGTIMPPFLNENSVIYIFESDLCRSLYANYNNTITIMDGIKLLGFSPNEYFYANYTINPDNAGFCSPANNCLPSGLLNLTNCVGGVPIIMSCPHFLFADDRIPLEVDGVKPNFEDHHTSIYIEPTSGLLMKANKRIQFNTQLFRDSRIDMTKNIPEVLYPLFWVDEHFEIDKKNADKFLYQVKIPLLILNIGKYVLFGIGVILFLVCCKASYSIWEKSKMNELESSNRVINNSDANNEQTPLLQQNNNDSIFI